VAPHWDHRPACQENSPAPPPTHSVPSEPAHKTTSASQDADGPGPRCWKVCPARQNSPAPVAIQTFPSASAARALTLSDTMFVVLLRLNTVNLAPSNRARPALVPIQR